VGTLRSNVIEAAGLPTPAGEPVAHHADLLAVETWPLRVAACLESEAPLLDPALSRPPPA
jgi:hypothetical protein